MLKTNKETKTLQTILFLMLNPEAVEGWEMQNYIRKNKNMGIFKFFFV